MGTLAKIRLSNCRKIKPFWADKDDVNNIFHELNKFVARYYHPNDHIVNLKRHNLIFFHQKPFYYVDGYEIRDHAKNDKRPRYKGNRNSRMRRRYRMKRYPKRYCTNTKTNYWATKGVYPIPLPKIIDTEYKHKDPSGINPITKDQLEKLIIENCFGIFYTNSVNYAKLDGWNICLHIDRVYDEEKRSYDMDVSPVEFLKTTYQYYKLGIGKIAAEKKIMRHISNVTYGWLKPILPMTMSYLDMARDFEFGKIIISCERDDYQYWTEIPLMVEHQSRQLITDLKTFITESKIDQNTKIEITFKTDVVARDNIDI